MKKLVVALMVISLVVAMGASMTLADNTKDLGHVAGDKKLDVSIKDDFAYVNPFAMVTFGRVQKAILEGDGGYGAFVDPGKAEGSIWAKGSVQVNLYCNCPVTMKAEVLGGSFKCRNAQNHPGNAQNAPYIMMPVDLSWDDFKTAANGTSQKTYDAWSYAPEILSFKVYARRDDPQNQFNPLSIDELHAGNYEGTVIVTVAQKTNTAEGAFSIQHNGACLNDEY